MAALSVVARGGDLIGRLRGRRLFIDSDAARKRTDSAWYSCARIVRGLDLLEELPAAVAPGLVDKAKVLDNFYVATRYANGHPEGPPFEHYGPIQSAEAIRHAGEIVEFVRAQMA